MTAKMTAMWILALNFVVNGSSAAAKSVIPLKTTTYLSHTRSQSQVTPKSVSNVPPAPLSASQGGEPEPGPSPIPTLREEIRLKLSHPFTTRNPIRSGLQLHGDLRVTRVTQDPGVSPSMTGAPPDSGTEPPSREVNPDREVPMPRQHLASEGALGFTVTPYVAEGLPPASLRVDALGRVDRNLDSSSKVGQTSGAQGENPNPLGAFIYRTMLRTKLGLRDLNLNSLGDSSSTDANKSPYADSLALPEGYLVAEVTTWIKDRLIKPEVAVGFFMAGFSGIEVDVLLPKHILVAFQTHRHTPKFHFGANLERRYRPALALGRQDWATKPTLELQKTTAFLLGLSQLIRSPWHFFAEAGMARTGSETYGLAGQTLRREQGSFSPVVTVGIQTLILGFTDRSRSY